MRSTEEEENIKRAVDNADAYYFAALLSGARFKIDYISLNSSQNLSEASGCCKTVEDGEFQLGAPPIALLGFAIELYLKILLMNVGVVLKKEHNIKSLFSNLESNDYKSVSRIIEIHRNARGDRDVFFEFVDHVKTSFVDWRYPFEAEFLAISPDVLFDLAQSVRAVVFECLPHVERAFQSSHISP